MLSCHVIHHGSLSVKQAGRHRRGGWGSERLRNPPRVQNQLPVTHCHGHAERMRQVSTDRQVPQRAVGVFPQQSPPSTLPPADRRHSPFPPAPPTPLTPRGHAWEETTAPTSSGSPCTRRASFLNAQKTHSLEKRPLLAFPAHFPRPLPPTVAVSPRAGTVSGGCGAPARGGRITSGASSRTQGSKSALVPAVPAKPHIPPLPLHR